MGASAINCAGCVTETDPQFFIKDNNKDTNENNENNENIDSNVPNFPESESPIQSSNQSDETDTSKAKQKQTKHRHKHTHKRRKKKGHKRRKKSSKDAHAHAHETTVTTVTTGSDYSIQITDLDGIHGNDSDDELILMDDYTDDNDTELEVVAENDNDSNSVETKSISLADSYIISSMLGSPAATPASNFSDMSRSYSVGLDDHASVQTAKSASNSPAIPRWDQSSYSYPNLHQDKKKKRKRYAKKKRRKKPSNLTYHNRKEWSLERVNTELTAMEKELSFLKQFENTRK